MLAEFGESVAVLVGVMVTVFTVPPAVTVCTLGLGAGPWVVVYSSVSLVSSWRSHMHQSPSVIGKAGSEEPY